MSKTSKIVQAELRSGTAYLMCWIDEGKAKVGDLITLKDHDNPRKLWTILSFGAIKEKSEINRGWSNNI